MNPTPILQACVDYKDYITAAHLCALEDRHVQALSFRLLAISQNTGTLSSAELVDLSCEVIVHHLK